MRKRWIFILVSLIIIMNYTLISTMMKEPEIKLVTVEIYREAPVKAVNPLPEIESMTYLGDFKLTAYCPCEMCCGSYGKNRPQMKGEPIVVTSSGHFAQEGITIAVDPKLIPYGSVVYIEGVGIRISQDCGGSIKNKRIDVYFNEHEDALKFGIKKGIKVWLVNDNINLNS